MFCLGFCHMLWASVTSPLHPTPPQTPTQAAFPVPVPCNGSWVLDSNLDEKHAAAKCEFATIPLAVLFEGTNVFNHGQKMLDHNLNERHSTGGGGDPSLRPPQANPRLAPPLFRGRLRVLLGRPPLRARLRAARHAAQPSRRRPRRKRRLLALLESSCPARQRLGAKAPFLLPAVRRRSANHPAPPCWQPSVGRRTRKLAR